MRSTSELPSFSLIDQTEISCSPADIADQDDVSGTDLAPPRRTGLGVHANTACGSQQDNLSEARSLGGVGGEIPRHFVEGRGNGQHDLAFRKIPSTPLDPFRV